MGPEKKGKLFDKETIKNTAFHEAGHTVVAYFTEVRPEIPRIYVVHRYRVPLDGVDWDTGGESGHNQEQDPIST